MPNKYVDNLKDDGDRYPAQQWQESLEVERLTTREWNDAAEMASRGYSNDEIRSSILDSRN